MTGADVVPAPAATFQVLGILVLGTRSLFILRWQVISGELRVGQRVIGIPGMDARVASLERRLLDVNGGPAQTAITFHYSRQAELAQWRSRVVEGMLLALA